MEGQILDYSVQTNSGVISASDGARYRFNGEDWKGDRPPTRGMSVDFEIDGNHAKSVFSALAKSSPGSKDKTAAGLLAIFLGGWGVHKFYLGHPIPGLVYLLTNTIGFAITWLFLFIPNIILGIVALIEGILYLTKSDEEFEQQYVVQKRPWF